MISRIRNVAGRPRWAVVGLALFVLGFLAACGGGVDLAEEEQQEDVSSLPSGQTVSADPVLRPGDCFNDSESLATASNRVPCAEPHEFEVYAFVETATGSFPGVAEMDQRGRTACNDEFLARKGVVHDISMLVSFWVVPSEETWAQGDRYIACAVQYPAKTAQTFDEIDALRSFGMVSTYQLAVGDCFQEFDEALVGARTVSCESTHQIEVYAATTLPEGPWPGDGAVSDQERTFCQAELDSFLGGSRSDIRVSILGPDETAWTQFGSRHLACILTVDGGVVGSQRNTGSAEEVVAVVEEPLLDVSAELFGGDLESGLWISVAEMNSNVISLQWQPIPDANNYTLSRVVESDAEGANAEAWRASVIYRGTAAGFVDDTVIPGEEYRYLLRAEGPDTLTGIQWRAAAAVSDSEPPEPVAGLIGVETDEGFLLQWAAATDNYRFAVYEVFRGTSAGALAYYDTVWSQNQTTFVDTDPPVDGSWFYEVYAVDFHGNTSGPSEFAHTFG